MYFVISIILITVMLTTDLFYLTLLHLFIGCYFENLSLSTSHVCGIFLKRFKDFKTFWPCYFTSTSVKGIYNFWKFRGIINGFNEYQMQIASVVKKWQMSKLVPYTFVPPLKVIYHSDTTFLGRRSHWG